MEKIYRTVSHVDGAKEFTKDEFLTRFRQTGISNRPSSRLELQGEPIIEGFLGPMYDGEKDGKPVVRYETQQMYNLLSV